MCETQIYLTFRRSERFENRWVLMLDQAAPGGLIKYNPHSPLHVAPLLPPVKRAIFFTKTTSPDELISGLTVRSQGLDRRCMYIVERREIF